MKPVVDKFGRAYDQLVARQKEELQQWQLLLRPDAYEALSSWCEMTNGPAEVVVPARGPYRSGGLHSVPVGQELHHFLMGYRRKGRAYSAVTRVPSDSELL